jgi:UDP-N-acetyl-D-galactosamine dehydrogenase
VYDELIALGMIVDLFDPNANSEQVYNLHNIQPVTQLKTYDAILLTVAHDQFLNLNFNALKSNVNSVIFDLKSTLPRELVDARL